MKMMQQAMQLESTPPNTHPNNSSTEGGDSTCQEVIRSMRSCDSPHAGLAQHCPAGTPARYTGGLAYIWPARQYTGELQVRQPDVPARPGIPARPGTPAQCKGHQHCAAMMRAPGILEALRACAEAARGDEGARHPGAPLSPERPRTPRTPHTQPPTPRTRRDSRRRQRLTAGRPESRGLGHAAWVTRLESRGLSRLESRGLSHAATHRRAYFGGGCEEAPSCDPRAVSLRLPCAY